MSLQLETRRITQSVTRSRTKTEREMARDEGTAHPSSGGPQEMLQRGWTVPPNRSAPLGLKVKVAEERGALSQGKEQPGVLRSQTS